MLRSMIGWPARILPKINMEPEKNSQNGTEKHLNQTKPPNFGNFNIFVLFGGFPPIFLLLGEGRPGTEVYTLSSLVEQSTPTSLVLSDADASVFFGFPEKQRNILFDGWKKSQTTTWDGAKTLYKYWDFNYLSLNW